MTQGKHLAEEHAACGEDAPAPMRLSDAEFERLMESGAIARLGRVELRGGEIWRMSPQFAPHMRMKLALWQALSAAVAGRGDDVGVEGTLAFPGYFPSPDVFVFTPHGQKKSIPAADVRLIVEVSDTTLHDDLGDKRARYAAGGIGEYWVVDMRARRILRFHAPADGAFSEAPPVAAGARCECVTLAGVSVATAGLPWRDAAAAIER